MITTFLLNTHAHDVEAAIHAKNALNRNVSHVILTNITILNLDHAKTAMKTVMSVLEVQITAQHANWKENMFHKKIDVKNVILIDAKRALSSQTNA